MKLLFGEISIRCFIAQVLLSGGLLFLWIFSTVTKPSYSLFFGLLCFLLPLAGIICAIIGAVKKEYPKKDWIIGLLLNSGFILCNLF